MQNEPQHEQEEQPQQTEQQQQQPEYQQPELKSHGKLKSTASSSLNIYTYVNL